MFQEEHTSLERSMESMIQFQNDPLDMIEARLSRLENMCKKYVLAQRPSTLVLMMINSCSYIF